jgi:hypothetical protein
LSNKYDTNKKEVISFRKVISPLEVITIKERIKAPGTVEELRVRFYRGQQLALEVLPYIEHKGRQIEELITFAEGTEGVLQGDDDYFVFPVVASVDYDDYIKVRVVNKDTTYSYTLSVDVVIDYYGGHRRVVGGAI